MFLILSPFDVTLLWKTTSKSQFSLCKKQPGGLISINSTEALSHSLVERITTLPSDRLYSHWYLFFPPAKYQPDLKRHSFPRYCYCLHARAPEVFVPNATGSWRTAFLHYYAQFSFILITFGEIFNAIEMFSLIRAVWVPTERCERTFHTMIHFHAGRSNVKIYMVFHQIYVAHQ